MKYLMILIIPLCVLACREPDHLLKQDWSSIGDFTSVKSIQVNGTICIVAVTSGSSPAISCDWEKK